MTTLRAIDLGKSLRILSTRPVNARRCLAIAFCAALIVAAAKGHASEPDKPAPLPSTAQGESLPVTKSWLGVYCVGEANPGPATSEARLLTTFRDSIYFLANDEVHGRELFCFDGKQARMVADINPGAANGYPSELFVFGDKLFYRADDGLSGKELFSYDGQRIQAIYDLWKGYGYDPYSKRVEPQNGNPSQLMTIDGVLYFTGRTRDEKPIGNVGLELFKYDGKTVQLAFDFLPGPEDGAPTCFTPFQGGFLLACRRPGTGQEVYWSKSLDGSSPFKLVADLIPGERGSRPAWFAAFKNEVVFLADSLDKGREMYRTHGEGAELVADLNPGKADSLASDFTVFGNEVIFRADDGQHGAETYAYDGKMVRMLADIYPGEKGSWPSRFFVYEGALYFGADGGPDLGRELYRYDGQAVQLALDINPGPGSSTPSDFVVYHDEAYFVADDGERGREVVKLIRPIWQIQGKGHKSPLAGRRVTTQGVVTAVDFDGFWLQDAIGDGDLATSDAMFVDTGVPPVISVGDIVRVCGEVEEKSSRELDLTNTCLVRAECTVISSGNQLPKPVVISKSGRMPPTEVIDDDELQRFDPTTDGIDFWESLESMRVILSDPVAVSGSNRFGDNFVAVDRGTSATNMSNRGNLNLTTDDLQPELIPISVNPHVFRNFRSPRLNTGDQLTSVTGIVGYKFGRFLVMPVEPFDISKRQVVKVDVTSLTGAADQMTVASYNVFILDPILENRANVPRDLAYDDVDDDVASGRYLSLARQIVQCLRSPDVLGLEELQDGDGAELSKSSDATGTLKELISAIKSVGGPQYDFIVPQGIVAAYRNESNGELVSPTGNMPGNNLQVGFLYNPNRVKLVPGSVQLLSDPTGQAKNRTDAFWQTPIPLAATFEFQESKICVIANHWTAKSGSTSRFGSLQPWSELQGDPQCNGSVDRRCAQAKAVADWIADRVPSDVSVIVLGDLNEIGSNLPIKTLEQHGLRNLDALLPPTERATTRFDGLGEQIDHILVSKDLAAGAEVDIVSVNSNFWEHPATADEFYLQGASDHDPILARFHLPASSAMTQAMPTNTTNAISNRPYRP